MATGGNMGIAEDQLRAFVERIEAIEQRIYDDAATSSVRAVEMSADIQQTKNGVSRDREMLEPRSLGGDAEGEREPQRRGSNDRDGGVGSNVNAVSGQSVTAGETAPLSADLTGKPVGEQSPAAPQPFKTLAQQAMDDVLAGRKDGPDRIRDVFAQILEREVAAERERCAALVERLPPLSVHDSDGWPLRRAARAIRGNR